jgi:hypothetical protein
MTWSAPSSWSRFSLAAEEAQAITRALRFFATCTQPVPTPPLAPRIRISSPGWSLPRVINILWAVP